MNDRFLRACRREPVDRTPIWLMRQAGRYMAEYRRLRERRRLLEIVKTPELAVEVTLQPLRAFALDAAIIFSDILPLVEGMGIELEFAHGEGPVIHNPVRAERDVAALRTPPAAESVPFTLEAIRLARRALEVPLIGFAGAPFTLASYLIEGGSSRTYELTKGMMLGEPARWRSLMEKLALVVGEYLAAQAAAGADALQLFDSWAGALSPDDYRAHVLPYTRAALAAARPSGVPLIYFTTGTGGMLEDTRAAGADVVGVDWRVDLDVAWDRLGAGIAIQGNLDPAALLAPRAALEERATAVLRRAGGRPGHVFNLGHGVLPTTPPESVAVLVDVVHGWDAAADAAREADRAPVGAAP